MDRSLRVFESHEAAEEAERAELKNLTPEERLRIGAELHAFWVRNYWRDASRLDRTVRIISRSWG